MKGITTLRTCLLIALLPGQALAGVHTDGSLGPAVELQGPDFVVGEALGTRAGSNLFHSFSQFSIAAGESATFTGSNDISNVIGRVTGAEASLINGHLRSEVGRADLWLMNPNGVIFGPKARLDIPGTFHLATADHLTFADQSRFGMDSAASSLTLAAPEQFGFHAPSQASITFQGSDLNVNGAGLHLEAGSIAATGADFGLQGDPAASLRWRADAIELTDSRIQSRHGGAADVPSGISLEADEISLSGSSITTHVEDRGRGPLAELIAGNRITFADGARLEAFGRGEGAIGGIHITAADLLIQGEGSGIASYRQSGAGGSGDIRIDLSGELVLQGEVEINSDTSAEGGAGDVIIHARNANIGEDLGADSQRAMISSDTFGEGAGGRVVLQVDEALVIHPNSVLASNTFGAGQGGEVRVQAGRLVINGQDRDQFTGISSSSLVAPHLEGGPPGEGDAGLVEIQADEIELLSGRISSDTATLGDAGQITLYADSLLVQGNQRDDARITSSSRFEGEGSGGAGQIWIRAGEVTLSGETQISTNTQGAGDAGQILIQGRTLALGDGEGMSELSSQSAGSGEAGDIGIEMEASVRLINNALISSDTHGSGDGGNIRIQAPDLLLDGQGLRADISSGSYAEGDTGGNAGAIELEIPVSLTIRGNGRIESDTGNQGNAGELRISAGQLALEASSGKVEITSDTRGAGNGGRIRIEAEGLTMSGTDGQAGAHIASDATETATGRAGGIQLSVQGETRLQGNALISSDTLGAGDGGRILFEGDTLTIDGQGYPRAGLSTSSTSTDRAHQADAGDMVIDLAGDLAMLDGAQLASFSQGRGSAGSITLTGVNLRMIGGDQQRSIIQSDTFTLGEGGEITLNLTGDLAMQQAAISSQTQGAADAGSIRIQARNLTMDGVGRPTLITSSAFASGSAGAIRLDIGDRLMLQDGGVITTSSVGEGDAGVIEITAGQLEMDGSNKGQPTLIASEARGEGEGLVGGVGDISIQAGEILLRNDANISIAARGSSDQSGEQRRIRLETGRLGLSRSTITAESDGDTPAANIEIHADGELVIADRTAITTASEQADAGEIRISGGRLSLEHSRITTSVSGEQGNGGNIQLNHDGVIMDQGFIQANTAAQGASGGEITLESPYLLVPRTQAFITGGDQRLDYDPERPASVIQAAAPDGISGQIEIEVPEIDLSASVLAVDAGLARLIELAPNPCRLGQSGIPSSLSLVGRGALPDDLAMGRARGHSTCNDSATPAE